MKYKVIGEFEVAGVAPGGEITEFEPGVNVEALIEGNHIEPVGASKAKAKDGS